MKIGVLSPDRSSTGGGVERFCWLLSEALVARGHEVTVVGDPPAPRRGLERLTGQWMRWSRDAGRQTETLGADVLITNGPLGRGISRTVRRVHVYHGVFPARSLVADRDLPVRELARRVLNAGLAEFLAGRGATVVAVSRSAARQARRFYGVADAAVIPNCVDTSVFTPGERDEARDRLGLPPRSKIALFVGRLEYAKGGDFVAEGVARGGFRLAVAGRTAPSGTFHLGQLATGDLVHAYRAADCIVLPSRYEACSLAGLEAIASGVPLICTRAGWFEDLLAAVPEYRALICEPTASSLAERLRALDRPEVQLATRRARDWVLRENSLHAFAERWGTLVERLAA